MIVRPSGFATSRARPDPFRVSARGFTCHLNLSSGDLTSDAILSHGSLSDLAQMPGKGSLGGFAQVKANILGHPEINEGWLFRVRR